MQPILLLAGLLAFTGQTFAAGLPYELASRRAAAAPETATGPGGSRTPFFSADGARLYFTSDLAGPGLEAAGPGTLDAFRRVPATGALELLSPRLPGGALERLGVVVTAASTNDQFVLLEGGAVLTDGDTNGTGDVFVRDTAAGVTHLVSVNAAGTGAGNGTSSGALMTPDARLVLFQSWASDLVAGDTNGAADVFLRERQTGQTTLLSCGPAGQAASSASAVMLAPDGQAAVFACFTTNLAAAPDDAAATDLHLWTPGGVRQLGVPGPGPGRLPLRLDAIPTTTGHTESADGRVLVFLSGAYAWINAGVTNRVQTAAWRLDLATGQMTRLAQEIVSNSALPGDIRSIVRADLSADGSRVALDVVVVAPDGTNSFETVRIWDGGALRTLEELVLTVPPGATSAPASLAEGMLSPDGTRLTFISYEPDVVPGAPGGEWELYVRDLATGQTRALSAPGGDFRGEVEHPETAYSPAGDQVAFVSEADGLAAGDTNEEGDVFLADVAGGPLRLMSAWPAAAGVRAPAGWSSFSAQAISGDGRRVMFSSSSGELVAGDTNGAFDGFVFDRPTGQVLLVSANTNGVPANAPAAVEQISQDGRYVLFLSAAPDLVSGDSNNAADAFLRDLQTGTTELISRSPLTGQTPFFGVTGAGMSSNARTILFSTTDPSFFQPLPPGGGTHQILYDRILGMLVPAGTNLGRVFNVALSGDGKVAMSVGSTSAFRAAAADGWAWKPFALPVRPSGFVPSLSLSAAGDILAFSTHSVVIITNLTTHESLQVSAAQLGTMDVFPRGLTAEGGHLLISPTFRTAASSPVPWFHVAFASGTVTPLNRRPNGSLFDFSDPIMDDTGQRIVFRSLDDDLVPNDHNGAMDVFLLELPSGAITLLSRGPDGRSAHGYSQVPAVSGDGQWVAFQSTAALVAGDGNGGPDVYLAPLDPLLPLRLMGARRHADGTLRLPWRGPGGPAHRLLGAEAVEGPWLPLGGEVPAGTTAGEFTVPVDGAAKRFFKVEER